MADFTVHIPDAFVPRLVDVVDTWVHHIDGLQVAQKYLNWVGKTNVDELTNKQKAELACIVFLWKLAANKEADDGATAGRDAARQQAEDDFIIL